MPTRGSLSCLSCPLWGWLRLVVWLALVTIGGFSFNSPVQAQFETAGPIRVEPASLVIDQQCLPADTATPHRSLSASNAARRNGSISISSPFRVAGGGQGGTDLSLEFDGSTFEQFRYAGQVQIHDFALDHGRTIDLVLHRVESFNDA